MTNDTSSTLDAERFDIGGQRKSTAEIMRKTHEEGGTDREIFCFLFQYFLNSSFELETMIFHFKIDRKRSLYFREKGFRTGLSDVPIEFPRTAQRFYTECTQDLFSFFFLYKISFGQKSKIVKF